MTAAAQRQRPPKPTPRDGVEYVGEFNQRRQAEKWSGSVSIRSRHGKPKLKGLARALATPGSKARGAD